MAKISYINLNPKEALELSFDASLDALKRLFGKEPVEKAFDISKNYPSVLSESKYSDWYKTAKIVGINPRITETYWGIVKYAMTLAEEWIHVMPLWQTGDRGSLYVQNSWSLSDELLDPDLTVRGYDSADKQLKLVVNILHAMGKIVGFDALPHTDSFSQIVFMNPSYFEWIKLDKTRTHQLEPPLVDYNSIHKEVEDKIITYLSAPANLYELGENERFNILFPKDCDEEKRRIELMDYIRGEGFETIPVTEHYPMRPVKFKKLDPQMNCAVFDVKDKSADSKIIGCITPYRWYKIDSNGYIEKDKPNEEVWNYFLNKINEFQKNFNFDFLRADMAHNQIAYSYNHKNAAENECDFSPDSKNVFVPKEMWAVLKETICSEKPYFRVLAESFYNNYYIDGITDMINKDVDIVLGNMNYKFLNEEYINWLDDFLNPFRKHFRFAPCVCIFSTDCDLEINNIYYESQKANECRYFMAIFMNLPSYMAIGYELRSLSPVSDCEYSNLYIKKQERKFQFGTNVRTFDFIVKMRNLYSQWRDIIAKQPMNFLRADEKKIIVWYYRMKGKTLLFLCSLDLSNSFAEFNLGFNITDAGFLFNEDNSVEFSIEKGSISFSNLSIGTCLILELESQVD